MLNKNDLVFDLVIEEERKVSSVRLEMLLMEENIDAASSSLYLLLTVVFIRSFHVGYSGGR